MVCLACLLPLFLVPIVNVLPILVDYIMAKIYGAFGWEYRKPVRVPPSCPYKPTAAAKKDSNVVHHRMDEKHPYAMSWIDELGSQEDSAAPHPAEKPLEADNMVEPTAKDKAA